jgi:hypothetical protein
LLSSWGFFGVKISPEIVYNRLNRFFSILLSILILLTSFGNLITYATFKANQAEIAKTLCVLRAQENNSCNGRCVLEKELKKIAEKEKQESSILKEKQETVYTSTVLNFDFTPTLFIEKNKVSVSRYCEKPLAVAVSVFHPPLV